MRFELEEELGACAISQLSPNVGCPDIGLELAIGELQVSVFNRNGTSNGVAFDRQISSLEIAREVIYGSADYQDMSRKLTDIVRLSGNPGGPYGVATGIGIRESEGGRIYIEVTAAGMADSEIRDIVPDQIEGYEVRVTRLPAPQYRQY